MQAAGLVLDKVETSHVTGWIDLGSEHHQPWGLVHGGVYTTAIESAAETIAASSSVTTTTAGPASRVNTNARRVKYCDRAIGVPPSSHTA